MISIKDFPNEVLIKIISYLSVNEVKVIFDLRPELFCRVTDGLHMKFFTKTSKNSFNKVTKPGRLFNKETLKKGHFALIEINNLDEFIDNLDKFIKRYNKKPNFLCILGELSFLEIVQDPEHDDLNGETDKYQAPNVNIIGEDNYDSFGFAEQLINSQRHLLLTQCSLLFNVLIEKVMNLNTGFINMKKFANPIPALCLDNRTMTSGIDVTKTYPHIFGNQQFEFPQLLDLKVKDSLSESKNKMSGNYEMFKFGIQLKNLKHLTVTTDVCKLENFDLPNLQTLSFLIDVTTKSVVSKNDTLELINFNLPNLKIIKFGALGCTKNHFDLKNAFIKNLEAIKLEFFIKPSVIGESNYYSNLEEEFISKILSLKEIKTIRQINIHSHSTMSTILKFKNIDKIEKIIHRVSIVDDEDLNALLVKEGIKTEDRIELNNLKELNLILSSRDYFLFNKIRARNVSKLTINFTELGFYPESTFFKLLNESLPYLKELVITGTFGECSEITMFEFKVILRHLEFLQIGNLKTSCNVSVNIDDCFKCLVLPRLKKLVWIDDILKYKGFDEGESVDITTIKKEIKIEAPNLESIEILSADSKGTLSELKINTSSINLKKIKIDYKIKVLKLIGMDFASFDKIAKTGLSDVDKVSFETAKIIKRKGKEPVIDGLFIDDLD